MKEKFIEKINKIKEEKITLTKNEKYNIDKQAKEYGIIIDWRENKNYYFKNIIEDYRQEKIYKIMRTSDINNY